MWLALVSATSLCHHFWQTPRLRSAPPPTCHALDPLRLPPPASLLLPVATAPGSVFIVSLACLETGTTQPASFTEIHDHLKRAAANLPPSWMAE